MLNVIYIILTLLIFEGCDRKSPPPAVDLDTRYDVIPSHNTNDIYPYSKFSYVMNNSIYEYPNGNTTQKFSNLSNSSLYLDQDENILFTLDKESNSSKLSSKIIQKETWSTADKDGNYLISNIRCYKPHTIDAYTWAEVHGLHQVDANSSIYYNYPLVSLTWQRNKNNQYDHIWAIVTKSSPSEYEPKIYEYIDLGARPDYFFPAEIHVKNNILEIKINYSTISTQNVSYWKNVPTYFQVGISINNYKDGGEAGVAFSDLRYENNESNVSDITHF